MSKQPSVVFDEDNPEWTDADFARSRSASATLPAAAVAAFANSRDGRPRGSNKEQVSLRLDRDVLVHFKAGGSKWQSRINATLKPAARSAIRINVREDYEVNYWTAKLGVTRDELLEAVRRVGDDPAAVAGAIQSHADAR